MVFSYNEMMLGFHHYISLEIRPDITKMEKYLDLGFSVRRSRPRTRQTSDVLRPGRDLDTLDARPGQNAEKKCVQVKMRPGGQVGPELERDDQDASRSIWI